MPTADPPSLLRLAGRPRIEVPGVPPLVLPVERRGMLLAVLALRAGWVARAELAALLWPALPRARALANLRKSLHQARALPCASMLETGADAARWPIATDLAAQAAAEREGRSGDAFDACAGPLLDGFDDPANPAWSAWLDAERAQHARDRQRLARSRLQALQGDDPAAAAELARALLADDPFDEDAVVALLGAERALQRYAAQRDVYRAYAQRLDEELGVEPSARVRAQLHDAAPAAARAAPAERDAGALVGRADDCAALLAALGARRAVVVTGPGGVGKSSLLKVALRRGPGASPPVWLALDDLADIAPVPARLAAELGIAAAPAGGDWLAASVARLAAEPRLVALDNCEHLAGIERIAARLLDAHPRVQVVATSRRRLDLAAAQVLPLGGLTLPADGAAADDTARSDAWRLFARAAADAQPALDTAAEAAAIGRIVRLLDGLPLAILLAAAWARHLPLAAIEADLQRSLDLLESAADGEERPEHRSLRATFEQSWRVLTVREQRCLAALAVFPGEGSRAAAQAVGGESLPLLAQLADKSLLAFGADGRMALHPLLRRFAAEKLDAPERADAARRHAQWHLQWMARHAAAVDRVEPDTMHALRTELENCRAAWRWAVAHGATDALAAAAPVLKQHFALHGAGAEGVALLDEARAIVLDTAPLADASLHLALAQLHVRLGRVDPADDCAHRAIGQARRAGRRDLIARGLVVLGGNLLHRGSVHHALRTFAQAERHARAAHDAPGVSFAVSGAALAHCDLGDYDRAVETTTEAVRQHSALGQWARAAIDLCNLSYIHLVRQDWPAAERAAAEGLAIAEREGAAQPQPALHLNLGSAATGAGRFDAADRHCATAIALARRHLNRDIETRAAAQRARIALARGDLGAARARLREALALARVGGSRQAQLDLVLTFARIAIVAGDATPPVRDWLRWYAEQPYLDPADVALAREALARLGRRPRRSPVPAFDLDDLLAQIDAALP